MVCLGFRQIGKWQPYHHLGREVFLTPVSWRGDDWFTAGEEGTVREWVSLPWDGGAKPTDEYDLASDAFHAESPRWTYLRDHKNENYRFQGSILFLRGTPVTLNEVDSPAFVGVRQSEFFTDLYVETEGEAAEAGVSFYMDECHHYDLFCLQKDGERKVLLRLCIGDAIQVVGQQELDGEEAAVSD